MWHLQTLLFFFVSALVLSAGVTYLLVKRSGRLGLDSPDDHRKQHERPISRLGGLAIFTALSIGFLVLSIRLPELRQKWLPVIITNALIFSIGFLDDLKPLGAKIKLIGQLGCALVLYAFGVSIDIVSNPFGPGSISLGLIGLPITLLWLIAVPNIVNLIDGMDGLATGFGLFLCLTLAFVGHYAHIPDVVLVSLVMAGALGGFLIFNLPPAKIFLGDGGSYLIGFFVASVSLVSSQKGAVIASLLVVLVALGIPILDTFLAILRRAIRGMPLFRADAEHIHHRLILLGYSKSKALAVLYTTCVVLSLAGISIMASRGLALPIVSAAVFLLAIFAVRYLGYVRNWRGLRRQLRDSLERRRLREYVRAHGTLLEMEIERDISALDFHAMLLDTLRRLDLRTAPAPGHLPLHVRGSHGTVVLHRPATTLNAEEWQFRGEMLEAALTRALEKWGDLPNVEVIRSSAEASMPEAEWQKDKL